MSAKELLHNWQESLTRALAEKLGVENVEDGQLLEAAGLQVQQTGLLAGAPPPGHDNQNTNIYCHGI